MFRRRRTGQTGSREVTAGLTALLYLWSVLFVAFAHNHLHLGEPADGAPASASGLRAPGQAKFVHRSPDPGDCIACAWDRVAGHRTMSVWTFVRPVQVVVSTLPFQPRSTSFSRTVRSSTRGPPFA